MQAFLYQRLAFLLTSRFAEFRYINDIDMSNTVITPSNGKQYKRRDRSVSPETAQKISSSLKSYNATHPRGKASDGSQWSKRISDSLKNNYWSQIPPKKQDGQDDVM